MTTFTRAAPGRSIGIRWLHLVALSTSVALAGCESGASLFGSDTSSAPETQVAQQAPPPPAVTLPRVAIAPVIGAPDTVGKQLAQDMSSAIGQQKVSVVPATSPADHTLRGYVVAARDRSGVKVSYIWDVTDPQGRRTNRITGEEFVANGNPKDPWSAVSAPVSQSIAQKAAGSFGSWIATQPPPAQAQPAVAAAPQPLATPAIASAPATPAPTRAALATPAAPTSTASIQSSATAVPNLVGAPGDGNSALAEALKAQLAKNGVSMTSQAASSYRVEGVVNVGPPRDGKQAIQIDWNVKDPEGKKLGTVTQKNDIPQGSLDRNWGKTADAAAEAAAQGILKLLPKTGTN